MFSNWTAEWCVSFSPCSVSLQKVTALGNLCSCSCLRPASLCQQHWYGRCVQWYTARQFVMARYAAAPNQNIQTQHYRDRPGQRCKDRLNPQLSCCDGAVTPHWPVCDGVRQRLTRRTHAPSRVTYSSPQTAKHNVKILLLHFPNTWLVCSTNQLREVPHKAENVCSISHFKSIFLGKCVSKFAEWLSFRHRPHSVSNRGLPYEILSLCQDQFKSKIIQF